MKKKMVVQRQILLNLRSVLTAGGSCLANVVKCNIYLTDMRDFAAVNEVYSEFFEKPMPVS
jgi:2-iminobutanoate/2-iminopropanoate deaminase